jgi:endonuclease V-like protein UPF0215 family
VNVIGFDDGPFTRDHKGDVLLVGAVCSGTRLDGVVSGTVRRDGANAARRMIEVVRASQFLAAIRAVLLQGIAVAGFNVVDVHTLSEGLGVPVLVVTRRAPDLASVHRALFSDAPTGRPRVRGARAKWALILGAGAIEPLAPSHRALRRAAAAGARSSSRPHLWVQRIGMTKEAARRVVEATTLHGHLPEPLRLAHLIAGGIAVGRSRGRA